jgi:RNA polymerase sigma factor (sigma-70 family)
VEDARSTDDKTPIAADSRLEELVRRYGRLIASAVARVGGQRTQAYRDDIEQHVLIGLWKHLRHEQDIERPSSYIYKVAVRETLRALEREEARRTAPLTGDGPELAAPPGQDPFTAATSRERLDQVEACLLALAPDRQRAVRAHLAGFEVAEIMGMYGWPYQKARNLIARGMAELRTSLRTRGFHG